MDRAATNSRESLVAAVVITASALVPLSSEPLRFEAHESYRAGLLVALALIGLCTLGGWRAHLRRLSRPLVAAVALWCAALTVSALLSLSPARSLFGDTIRQMGLWTNLALAAGFLLGSTSSLERIWRWFWLAGAAVSVYVVLEFAGILGQAGARPDGPLGLTTATGSWLALALVWSALGFSRQAARGQRRRTLVSGADLLLMLIALALTGARAALLGLAGSLTLLGLAYAAATHRRRSALLVLLVVALGGAGWIAANVIPPDRLPPVVRPLISRLKLKQDDPSMVFRETVWSNSLHLAATWPALVNIDGQRDGWAAIRPLIGYGPEMFEAVHRPLLRGDLYIPDQRVDRAHNDWLDALLTMGWLGAAARALTFIAVWVVALRRLGLYRRWAPALPAAGALAGGLLAGAFAAGWLPVAITLGALAGAGLGLLASALTPRSPGSDGPTVDGSALLALAVVACHLLDLQFGFEQAATGWPMWLAIGLLAAPTTGDSASAQEPDRRLVWTWAGLAGAILLRSGVLAGANAESSLLLVALLWIVVALHARPQPRESLLAPALLAAAGLTTRLTDPVWTALADLLLLGGGLLLLAGVRPARRISLRGSTSSAVAAGVAALGLALWVGETIAQVHLLRGGDDELRAAADMALWDDRIAADAAAAAFTRLQRQLDAGGPLDQPALDTTTRLLDRSVGLNGYDADHALQWATVETNLALIAQNPQPHIDRAARLFAAATTLWPTEASLWVAWGRFALDVQQDAPLAYRLGRRAVCLPPLSLEAIKLFRQAGRAARLDPYVNCDSP